MIINNMHVDDRGVPVSMNNLHDAIMNAWQTVEDIKCLVKSSENMTEDQMLNALIGLEIFADMRCHEVFDMYENIMHNQRVALEQGNSHDKGMEALRRETIKALDAATESFGQGKI
tara:strand:- start:155 stop:502 length:348 start_codon:yes stop_codon:yes gene_type:complete